MERQEREQDVSDNSQDSADRRRHTRIHLGLPVMIFCNDEILDGCTLNESYSGLLIKIYNGRLPEEGESCKVVLEIMGDRASAMGTIIRSKKTEKEIAIELTQLGPNGGILIQLLMKYQSNVFTQPASTPSVLRCHARRAGKGRRAG